MVKNRSINGKKILFLAPSFFGYELKIKSKMEELGASVNYYDARSISGSLERAFLKISPRVFKKKSEQYFGKILSANKTTDYDYVFIIKCDMISKDMLHKMKSIFKNAKFCLYLWDSIKNIPGISAKFSIFDKVLSFDRYDVKNHSFIQFRPLFYIDDFKIKDSTSIEMKYKYDLCFCGTVHSDRYRIIREVQKYCVNNNYYFFNFLYLQSEFIYRFYKIVKREFTYTKIDDFNYDKLSGSEISKIVNESRVILDIQHPNQTGLTMRTIEMIGMKKKLITTNQDIINYDFYNPNNILVIPRGTISIPEGFLSREYESLEKNIYQNYSVKNWILDVLTEINEEIL